MDLFFIFMCVELDAGQVRLTVDSEADENAVAAKVYEAPRTTAVFIREL